MDVVGCLVRLCTVVDTNHVEILHVDVMFHVQRTSMWDVKRALNQKLVVEKDIGFGQIVSIYMLNYNVNEVVTISLSTILRICRRVSQCLFGLKQYIRI